MPVAAAAWPVCWHTAHRALACNKEITPAGAAATGNAGEIKNNRGVIYAAAFLTSACACSLYLLLRLVRSACIVSEKYLGCRLGARAALIYRHVVYVIIIIWLLAALRHREHNGRIMASWAAEKAAGTARP